MEAKYSTNICETLRDEGGFAHYQLLQGADAPETCGTL